MSTKTPSTSKSWWLDDRRNVDKVVYGIILACTLLLVGDLFVHPHGHFAFEHWFGFYGIFGFVSCVGLVIAAKGLRLLLKRPENYYDPPPDVRGGEQTKRGRS